MKLPALVAAALALMSLATGCATLRGDKQKVKFETEPPGATLVIGDQTYTTPAEVTIKRKETPDCTVSLPGYQTITFTLKPRWDGASLTDLAVPGGSILFGWSLVSGADKKFDQLAKITLVKTADSTPTKVEMFQQKDRLLTKEEYEKTQQKK